MRDQATSAAPSRGRCHDCLASEPYRLAFEARLLCPACSGLRSLELGGRG